MKAIKNDYDTSVMYGIAKVAGKLKIFVSHNFIDLSTVLIPNDGSLEESFACIISEETKIKQQESLRQYTKKIKEQEDLIDTISDQLAEEKNIVKIKQTTISELKECLCKKDYKNEHLKSKIVDFTTIQDLRAQVKELQSENEHLKSKVVDFITVQTFQVQVEELKSVNESLNLSVEELSKARALAEATLRERDEIISAQYEKMRLLEEQFESFYEVPSEFDSEIVHDTQDNLEKDLILGLQT
ncbi:hypothetical protein Tco_1010212 [Tanacetum coccineum]